MRLQKAIYLTIFYLNISKYFATFSTKSDYFLTQHSYLGQYGVATRKTQDREEANKEVHPPSVRPIC